jgi:tRNA(Ile2) C34 agmatinyltransferase TiaS
LSKVIFYIGIDDTDNLQSRGTGRLARSIAEDLQADFVLLGVTRHQLLVDPRVPYTSHNSSATICIQVSNGSVTPAQVFERVRALMLADFIPGSDPGLCVASEDLAGQFTAFGRRAKTELVSQAEARQLAVDHAALLEGLGGTQDGVIGALAAVGLAAGGEDGRYLLVGKTRELTGLQPVETVLESGIHTVMGLDKVLVVHGLVLADKLRPARRHSQPVLFVDWNADHWEPLKLD